MMVNDDDCSIEGSSNLPGFLYLRHVVEFNELARLTLCLGRLDSSFKSYAVIPYSVRLF